MSASESYSDDNSTSYDSDSDVVEDYELEVEEFDSPSEQDEGLSTSPSTQGQADMPDNPINSVGAVAVAYENEPIADDDWVEKYEEERETDRIRFETLEERLNGTIPTSDWCKCNNCDTSLLQNVYEAQCCQEIDRCTKALCSDEVLQDVETPPTCVLHHPGFRINCLEKWSLRMAAPKYKTKSRRRYRQQGSEETYLQSIAYREFSQLVYGILGRLRIPLPACAYNAIRKISNT
ncbi:uncharacterized protein LOC114518750 [Dendronephthya gigantea]|uniref:uncharacterized protein LOC114518750 n=1 Tax=Dendronephthya gigantea TaxID=151771 RepID=UPI00106D2E8B|nr:uncharacterized protein LOC114518750 [Dendronephthya gigantea]